MPHTDVAHCRSIVRAHARTFWLASQLLPAPKRRAAYAVYAFCRAADDIVDLQADVDVARASIGALRTDFDNAFLGAPEGPVLRELAHAVRSFGIPPSLIHELVDGVLRDCQPVVPDTWEELEQYCQGVASSVGEMCTFVFGVDDRIATLDRARDHARTLGVAMQLTNILRDIGEDAARGRCYLPVEDLARYGLTRAHVLGRAVGRDPRWRELMQFEIARARALYESATPAIALLARDSQRCARACAIGYAAILNAIERLDYNTFHTRARLGAVSRAAVLWNAWRMSHPVRHASEALVT